ncbi:MAG: glycogen/starch/alpha-glucan phosphorylase, partial [Lachnospiraceae bacterium]|nr:glycogen/starch/alpha-glucan phosphorylase [Lachnospiraceae bacterium]
MAPEREDSKEAFKEEIKDNVKRLFRKEFEEASTFEVYQAVSLAVKDIVIDNWIATQDVIDRDDPKIVYYMSMEFLIGRALGNNLINLSAYKMVQEALNELGVDLNLIEDQEPDPALGNGGLGRLAACFLDSLSTLGYAAYGCGIRYHYGMFRQKIRDGYQKEAPDDWLKNGYPFELKRQEYSYEIKFGGYVRAESQPDGNTKFIQEGYNSVIAVPYDIPIVGYKNHVINSLMIWDAEPKQEFSLESFDRGDYAKAVEDENLARTLCDVLYPNDSHESGKELRLKQQYFFVSASLHRALDRFKKHHKDINELPDKVVFQMNDTHPTLTVPELMRILMDEEGLGWDDAWDIVSRCTAYTNHTIMSEALEKWPVELFS